MIIQNIKIENFKIHEKLEIKLENKNTLILGENGSGKSSLYFALLSIFYKCLRKPEYQINNIYKYRNSLANENISIQINFDENKYIYLENNQIITDNNSLNKNFVYFINRDILNNISEKRDFFIEITNLLCKNFTNLEELNNIYQELALISINPSNLKEKIDERFEVDEKLKKLLEAIEEKANYILEKDFLEEFKIKFNFVNSKINTDNNYKFDFPQIILNIDGLDNIQKNFNEAKIRLASISILFSLIELNAINDNNYFKLMVFDDFLTSLDMANRTFIIKYILSKFNQYQLMILTHNLQFNNLIENYIDKNKEWNFLHLYKTLNSGIEKSELYYKSETDLDEIKTKINNITSYTQYKEIGNLLRKEFEKLLHEFDKNLKIGKIEKSTTIIDDLCSSEKYFYTDYIKLISDINNAKEIETVKKILDEKKYDNTYVKVILKELNLFKKYVLNPSSHNDINSDLFHKEYKKSYKLLIELNDELKKLKSLNNQGA